MADRTLTVKIGANVQGLVSSLRTAQQATSQWVDRTQAGILANRDSINTLALGFGVVGGALTAAAGVAVARFADFDAAMDSVQASTMETADNMDLLRQAALDAGQETVYSATEAAGAIEALAKAGVSTADILNGGLSGALNLAASDNIAVAEAAEIAASAMTQFGLAGEDVEHVADLLAAGAGKAQGGVSDLGQALNQAGLVSSQFGLSIEEAVGTLTAFASAGMVGSDAGTSFRTMLLRLANPSNEAAAEMERLGIAAYDAQGNFVGMASLAGQLQAALAPLPQVQRDAALATIFGQDAIRGANILYEQGVDGINGWIAAVDDAGFAAEQAAIRMDNLKGDIEQFLGALETALIGAGEGGDGLLRPLVQSATDAVNAFSELPSAAQQATVAIAGAAGLGLLGVAAMGKLLVAVVEVRAALQSLPAVAAAAKASLAGIAPAVFVASVAAIADGVLQAGAAMNVAKVDAEELAAALREAAAGADVTDTALSDLFKNQAALSFLPWVTEVESLDDALSEFGDSAREALSNDFWERVDRFGSGGADMATFRKQVEQLDAAFASMVAAGSVQEATELYEQFTQAAIAQGVEAEALAEFFPQYAAALDGSTDSQKISASATYDTNDALAEQRDLLQDVIDAQREAAGIVLDLRSAQRQWETAIDDANAALKENGATLDINTAAGRENQAALDAVADAGWDLIDSMKANGAEQSELQSTMQSTRDRFISLATSMGMSKGDAEALADALNLIPANIESNVTVKTQDAQRSVDTFINRNTGRRLTVWVDAKTGSQTGFRMQGNHLAPSGLATGGAVFGPGTGTSDSIPAWLSNGEHVWTAREVAAAGGHGAMAALRKLALTGGLHRPQGFMNGGPVVLPPVQVSAPRPVGASGGSGPLVEISGQIVAADPQAAMRAVADRMKLELAGAR